MRLLSRSFIAALGLLVVAGLIAITGFNVAAAALGWPGLILVNALGARFGIYLLDSPAWMWLVPGLLIDLVLYTMLFFVVASLWRVLVAKFGDKQPVQKSRLSPATDDQQPTTQS